MSAETVDLQSWIGKTETSHDIVTPGGVAAMSATLDRDDPQPRTGDALPPLWHWMYFAPKAPRAQLGEDGHPKRGGFLPPVALPRRMFAGAHTVFHRPLRVGQEIRREGTVTDVMRKEGRSGELIFVKVRYETHGPEGLALEEQQDIVYRHASAPARTPAKSDSRDAGAAWRRTWTPDPVTLFRYSALTFNGHRIHYDRPYATEVEGYPGLLVHGPLIATLLVELCRAETNDRPFGAFRFQAKRPLFDTNSFQVIGAPTDGGDGSCWLQALDPEGAVAMDASVVFAE